MPGRVLIISYYTPPLGMGGVQRVAKLVKYLPRSGWQPTVLTVKPIAYYARDPSLLADVKNARLFRSASLDPARLAWLAGRRTVAPVRQTGGFVERMVRSLLPFDSKSPWIPFAYRLGKRVVRSSKPDVIFSTAPPFSAHVVGLLLKKKFGLPLVVDFRDPYLDIVAPTPCHRALRENVFERVKRSADGFVAVTETVATALGIPAVVVENGFDPDDFTVEPAARDIRFTIGYMGALIDREGATANFLRALDRLEGVVLKIAGPPNPDLTGLVDPGRTGRAGNKVEYLGYLDHRSAVAFIKSCDLLWLPTVVIPGRPPPVTGKFFEYLAAGRPILATVPERSDIARYLADNRAGIVVPAEPEAIRRAIEDIRRGGRTTTPKPVDRFSRTVQAERIGRVLDRAVGRTSAQPRFP